MLELLAAIFGQYQEAAKEEPSMQQDGWDDEDPVIRRIRALLYKHGRSK